MANTNYTPIKNSDVQKVSGWSSKKILWLYFILCCMAVIVIPNIDKALGSTSSPGFLTFFGVGFTLIVFTALSLYIYTANKTNIPEKFIVFSVIYTALVVLMKFTISPYGLYDLNKTLEFTAGSLAPNPFEPNIFAVALAGGSIFLLYALIYSAFYKIHKSSLKEFFQSTPKKRNPVVWGVILIFMFIIVWLIVASRGGIILLPLLFVSGGMSYLIYVFKSLYGVVISISIVVALYFLSSAFGSLKERTRAIKDVTVFTSVAWLGLSFIFVLHAVWVVYFLVLMTIWPFKTYTPK